MIYQFIFAGLSVGLAVLTGVKRGLFMAFFCLLLFMPWSPLFTQRLGFFVFLALLPIAAVGWAIWAYGRRKELPQTAAIGISVIGLAIGLLMTEAVIACVSLVATPALIGVIGGMGFLGSAVALQKIIKMLWKISDLPKDILSEGKRDSYDQGASVGSKTRRLSYAEASWPIRFWVRISNTLLLYALFFLVMLFVLFISETYLSFIPQHLSVFWNLYEIAKWSSLLGFVASSLAAFVFGPLVKMEAEER